MIRKLLPVPATGSGSSSTPPSHAHLLIGGFRVEYIVAPWGKMLYLSLEIDHWLFGLYYIDLDCPTEFLLPPMTLSHFDKGVLLKGTNVVSVSGGQTAFLKNLNGDMRAEFAQGSHIVMTGMLAEDFIATRKGLYPVVESVINDPAAEFLLCDNSALMNHLWRRLPGQLSEVASPSLFLEHELLELLRLFCENSYSSAAEEFPGLSPEHAEGVRKVRKYIDLHFAEDCRLQTLAPVGLMNISTLKWAFKKAFGITVHRYTVKRRMEYASLLISEGKLSLGEIVQLCGYESRNHFNERFYEVYGLKPGDIMKE